MIGGPDFIRRTCSDFDFIKDKPSKFDKERIYGNYIKEIKFIKQLKNRGRLPMKVIFVSPPCLSDYLEEYQAIVHCMAGITRMLGFPYILTGTDILATKTIAPSGISKPAVWRFLVSVGQALYGVGVSQFITLTQSDLLGRDLYEWWYRLVTTQSLKYQHGFLESPDAYRLYVENWKMEVDSQSMWDSTIIRSASDDAKNASKAYRKQVVEPAKLNYQANELRRAPGVLPEPPVYADPEDRPRADKPSVESNEGIGLLRSYAQQVVNAHINSYDRAVRILLETTLDTIFTSIEVDSQPLDLKLGLASIGERWTVEGIRQSHPNFPETDIHLLFQAIGNLNFIQFHALLMAVGEMKFIFLGPVEVFGHFMAQIKIYEAFFLNLWSFGLTEPLTQAASVVIGSAAPKIQEFRLERGMEMIGAQERGELGLLGYLNALTDQGMLTSNPKRLKRDDAPHAFPTGISSGPDLALRFCVPWADLKRALPQYMTQRFGLAYVAMFPDLPAYAVLNDTMIYNVLSVAYGQNTHPPETHVRLTKLGLQNHFNPPMPIELAIKKTGEQWLARSHSRYMAPQTQDSFPELQLRRHPKGKLPAKCDTETLSVVTALLQTKAGEEPQIALQPTLETLSNNWSPWKSHRDTRKGTMVPYIDAVNLNPCAIRYLLLGRPRFATVSRQVEIRDRPALVQAIGNGLKHLPGPSPVLNLHKHLRRQWDLPPSSSTLPRGVVKNELANQEARHDLQTIPTLNPKPRAIIVRFEGDVYEIDISKSPVFLQLARIQQFPNIELIMCVDITKNYLKIAHRQERLREAHPELAIDTPRNPNQTMLLSMEDLIEAAGKYNLEYLSIGECVKAEAYQREFETVQAINMIDSRMEPDTSLVMPFIASPPIQL